MTAAVVYGAGAGLGLWLLATGLLPRRPSLAEQVAAHRPAGPRAATPRAGRPPARGGWAARLGRPLTARFEPDRAVPGRVRADLAVLGRDPAVHLAEKATTALAGLLLPPLAAGLLALAGAGLPAAVPAGMAAGCAAAGFVVPDLGVAADAARLRRDLRHAFGAFLDLVVVATAGGAGLEQALADAASAGTGTGFTLIRRALDSANLTRRPPWTALARLGDTHGVPEIVETAASVALAGTEGAKIRASLTAKATSIRTRQLADAEADAASATERMSLPVVVLFAGFLLLIGYPAVARVAESL